MTTTVTSALVEVQDGKLHEDTDESILREPRQRVKLDMSRFEPTNINVWDEIVKRASRTTQFLTTFSTIFVLGNKSAGKTTLINNFLEKSETPKPTFALDYAFARLRSHDKKQVCHIWELGGNAKRFSDLIEVPIVTNENLSSMAMFLVLDLSEPTEIWPALDATINLGKKAFKAAVASMDKQSAVSLAQALDEQLTARLSDAMDDKDNLDPFPIPLVIIATKYDLFEKFEPEQRKTICRILRTVSHRNGASLNFFCKDDISLNRRMREIFSHYAFGTSFPTGICQDMNKALMIPHGADSYEQISPGATQQQYTMEYCRHMYESKIGKAAEPESIRNDTALDPSFESEEIGNQFQTKSNPSPSIADIKAALLNNSASNM